MGKAQIRFLHASSNKQAIDVFLNGTRLLSHFACGYCSNYFSLPSGHYTILLSDGKNKNFLDKEIQLKADKSYTLAVADNEADVDLFPIVNEPKVPFGESKIRFFHLAQEMPALDLAVKDRDVVFPDVSYKQVTEYLPLTPMTVDLELRTAGTKQVILPLPKLRFMANTVYTLALAGTDHLLILKD